MGGGLQNEKYPFQIKRHFRLATGWRFFVCQIAHPVRRGDIILELSVNEPKEGGQWIMQREAGAEVLEPMGLREWVRTGL